MLDMVARIRALEPIGDGDAWLVLVHIEIESAEQTTRIKPRMPRYYYHLRATYDLPVLPIVIYLNLHLRGIGEDTYTERMWDFEVNIFRYLYVALAGLNAVEYVKGDNWLGVALAALMRIPEDQIAWLGAEALRRLGGAPITNAQRYLLAECVEAYLPVDDAQRQETDQQLANEAYKEVEAMNKTAYEQGFERGLRIATIRLLQGRFGTVPQSVRDRISLMSAELLNELMPKIADAKSVDELDFTDTKPDKRPNFPLGFKPDPI